MKLSQKLLIDVSSHLTPSPGPSGMSVSSKTPGRDLEDRWRLDMVPDVRSWWNFHRHFWWMFPPIWHHLHVHQEFPCPPRLQEETFRTGVLTWFLISDLDETFTDTYDGCSLPFDTFSRSVRNVNFILDSRKGLGGQVESWHASCCQILIKLLQALWMAVPSHLTPSAGLSGTSKSS